MTSMMTGAALCHDSELSEVVMLLLLRQANTRRPDNRLRNDHPFPIERDGWSAMQHITHFQGIADPTAE